MTIRHGGNMNEANLGRMGKGEFSRRSLLKASGLSILFTATGGRAFGSTLANVNTVIGRPTSSSIAVSLIAGTPASTYIEYGYKATALTSKTPISSLAALTPKILEIGNLKSNSQVFYRVRSKTSSDSSYILGETNSFFTQRKSGSTFSFVVQGDSHPERPGKMFNADLYVQTLSNIAKQKPDFMVTLGDDFSIDPLINKGGANQAGVENIYATQRNWLSAVAKSIPIFLVNGNHEQSAAYLLDGTANNPAVLAGNARLKYFPLPDTNSFYSADNEIIPFVGKARDYYSWTWGDALFVTLDPYWHSKNPVDNVAGVLVPEDQNGTAKVPGAKGGGGGGGKKGGAVATPTPSPSDSASASPATGNGKVTDLWSIGLGDTQYAWFKKTLETSKAKYKFVFAHHVMGTGRGGVEVSTNYEWGGKDPKGNSTFAQQRPGWDMPIHDLMVKNGVTIFFQGHDHIFVHQERDGLIYQSMPNPADDTFSMFNEAAYLSGTKAPNSGHVRVTVGPNQGKVEYFLSARAKDESANRKNLQIAHSYEIKAKN